MEEKTGSVKEQPETQDEEGSEKKVKRWAERGKMFVCVGGSGTMHWQRVKTGQIKQWRYLCLGIGWSEKQNFLNLFTDFIFCCITMHNDSFKKLDACALIMEEAHSPQQLFEVKVGQNIVSLDAKQIESQLIAHTIHNDQVYIGSKRKF